MTCAAAGPDGPDDRLAHGTVEEQIKWLNEGYRSGRPADCDAVWAGPAA